MFRSVSVTTRIIQLAAFSIVLLLIGISLDVEKLSVFIGILSFTLCFTSINFSAKNFTDTLAQIDRKKMSIPLRALAASPALIFCMFFLAVMTGFKPTEAGFYFFGNMAIIFLCFTVKWGCSNNIRFTKPTYTGPPIDTPDHFPSPFESHIPGNPLSEYIFWSHHDT